MKLIIEILITDNLEKKSSRTATCLRHTYAECTQSAVQHTSSTFTPEKILFMSLNRGRIYVTN